MTHAPLNTARKSLARLGRHSGKGAELRMFMRGETTLLREDEQFVPAMAVLKSLSSCWVWSLSPNTFELLNIMV